ncbi:MAG: undecaprenyl-diphosphate phosphatase [Eubacteriales bacterium]
MLWIELLKAMLIGLVQGITEWLPVSSTGHMILLNQLLTLDVSESFMELFLVVIQLGSILAVAVLYFRTLNPFSKQKSPAEKRQTLSLWGKVLVGVIPAAVLGFWLDDWFNRHFYTHTVVAAALLVYGVLFIVLERLMAGRPEPDAGCAELSYRTALGIGLFQVLSLIPGTSRSGSTILGGRILGVSRKTAAEFSFFLAIPVMAGASLLKAGKFFLAGNTFSDTEWLVLAVGCLVAFFVSLVAISFLIDFVRRHTFEVFGWYRIVLGATVLLFYFF